MFGSYETLSRKERRAAKKFAQEREKTEQCIRRFGWKLCGVGGNYDHFPFIYTIGNHECGLPELLMTGCEDGELMNRICEKMRKQNRPFQHGELIDLGGQHPLKALNGNREARTYAWQAEAYYGTDKYAVQQIVCSDKSGRYPGDLQCDEPYCLVPILTGKSRLPRGVLPDFARIKTN